MAVTVNKLDYIYKKLLNEVKSKMNDTVEISDEEYGIIYEGNNSGGNNEHIVDPSEEDKHDYSKDYLTFEALEDGTFSFTVNDLYYSTNNGSSWKSLAAGTETELITAGTKVLWKRTNKLKISGTTYSDDYTGIFSSTGDFNISGNILSLFYTSNFDEYNIFPNHPHPTSNYGPASPYNCKSLFRNCIHLINANNLVLPTNLTEYCYCDMFYGCTSLITAPILSATTLVYHCYDSMFYDCTSLNYIKCLATDISEFDCTTDWVNNVSSSGIFIKNSKATFNIGDSGIPAGWEVIDEVVPEE